MGFNGASAQAANDLVMEALCLCFLTFGITGVILCVNIMNRNVKVGYA